MEELTQCPLCGEASLRPFLQVKDHSISQEQFEIRTCDRCGFAATTPRPTQNEIHRYYESTNYISHTNEQKGLQARLYQWAREQAVSRKHRQIRHYCAQGSLLDYGCGTGEFLGYMKAHGYRTTGIEPSSKARELAAKNHGLQPLPSLDQLQEGEAFDIITLWHVLEHVHDLASTVERLSHRLKPGGTFIIAVPDRESWDAQHYGPEWAAYDVPRHLWHFRRQDIHRLLEQHRLQLDRTTRMWMDALYIGMHSERYRGAGPVASMLKGFALGLWSNLVSSTTSRPTSSSLFFARKGQA